MTACSAPPVYKSTGNQYFTLAALKEALLVLGLVYLKKYQEEHMKVSIVSVSLRAGPEHLGQAVLTNDWQYFRGDSPVGLNSALGGSKTGKSSSGTATMPHLSQ
jgi:hypothetical protein